VQELASGFDFQTANSIVASGSGNRESAGGAAAGIDAQEPNVPGRKAPGWSTEIGALRWQLTGLRLVAAFSRCKGRIRIVIQDEALIYCWH